MNRVQREWRYWDAFGKATPKQRAQLIRYATPHQLDGASELSYNFLRGALPLGRAAIRRLAPQKQILRRLGDPRRPLDDRRRWFQKGGTAVGALVQGLRKTAGPLAKKGVRRLVRGATKAVKKNRKKIVRGVARSARRGVTEGLEALSTSATSDVPREDDDDDPDDVAPPSTTPSRQTRIDQLQKDIEQMEAALKPRKGT